VKALYFDTFGEADVLRYGDVAEPTVGAGEVLVKTTAIGLNFADVYRRRGNYHLAGEPPFIAGYEAAGVVVESGARVAFADVPFANAELVSVPRDKLIPLPDDIADETAAALLLQGLTAHYLMTDSYAVRRGDVAIVHAAAGGVGSLLVQLLVHAGARAVAFVSTEEKKAAALSAGATQAYTYAEGWPQRAGDADVVFDAVGTTLDASLQAIKPGGTVVFYGFAGGDPKPVDPRVLMDGSKRLIGGDLWNVLTSSGERIRRANLLFDLVRKGALIVPIAARYALSDGAAAHAFLESRAAMGKVLLTP
jgi:NADPH2:quinone reductase